MKNIKLYIISLLIGSTLHAGEFINIGTGSLTGTYYPTGGSICYYLNKDKSIKDTIKKCNVESTGGSVYNINNVKNNELNFAIAQSDIIYQAANGTGRYKNSPHKKLRSVMAIYPELYTLVTNKKANINKFTDLKNKNFNIGVPGSGDETTSIELFKAYKNKISLKDLKNISRLKTGEAPNAMRDGLIDAYVFMVGHPTANIKDVSNSVDINIVELDDEVIDKFIKDHPYFAKSYIPAGLYKGVDKDVKTFGVKAVLVTNSDQSEESVYQLTKAIIENLEEFKKIRAAYSSVTKESLLEGLSAPLHEGAKRYYKEIGLIK